MPLKKFFLVQITELSENHLPVYLHLLRKLLYLCCCCCDALMDRRQVSGYIKSKRFMYVEDQEAIAA